MATFKSVCMSFVCMCLAAVVPLSSAEAGRNIEWSDLLPKAQPLVDPYGRLTQDQRFDIETIIWARGLAGTERELDYNRQPLEDAATFERQFRAAGIDVDKLIQEAAAFQAEVGRRQQLVNGALNGEKVRISGYLLPIEFSETGEKDFLLVPYVGACVHVPPPPANQIILVTLAEKKVVKDLFTPVWLEGRITTKSTSKALTLADGSRDVSIGYHIAPAVAEPYQDKR